MHMTTPPLDILGPFLCRPTSSSMGFWLSLGCENKDVLIEIKVWQKSATPPETSLVFESIPSRYGIKMVEVADLLPDTSYAYEILVDGKPWSYPDIQACDYQFTTFPKDRDIDILLMSCHGIEAYQKDPHTDSEKTWNMWGRALEALKANPECRLGLLGGDQVYMDYTFEEDISKFDSKKIEGAEQRIYKTYKTYWGNASYRLVLMRLPCLLMWDDHDIIDGWGSRAEQSQWRTKKKWSQYGPVLFKAFNEMQAIRNVGSITKRADGPHSFIFSHHQTAILGLDLRHERRQVKDSYTMLSDDSKQEIEAAVDKLTDETKTLYILSPVTLARMSGKIEFFLGSMSNLMLGLGWGHHPYQRVLFWFVIFSLSFLALYTESPQTSPLIQFSFVFALILFPVISHRKFKRYFPNGYKFIVPGLIGIELGTLSWIASKLNDLIDNHKTFSAVFSIIKTDVITSLSSSMNPLFWITGFIVVNWTIKNDLFQKLIKNSFRLDKNQSMALARWLTGTSLLLLSVLLYTLWWIGPPKLVNLINLAATIALGLLTIMLFFLTYLEATKALKTIAGLNDDILDGWSAPEHTHDLEWLSKLVVKASAKGRKVYLLCGDIHTGGLSRITFHSTEGEIITHQITSSPISYVTMPPIVEKLTSGIRNVEFGPCHLANIFFKSSRNFVVLSPKKNKLEVRYYFEDLPDSPVIFYVLRLTLTTLEKPP